MNDNSCGTQINQLRDAAIKAYKDVHDDMRAAGIVISTDALLSGNADFHRIQLVTHDWIAASRAQCGLTERLCRLGRLWLMTQADQVPRQAWPCGAQNKGCDVEKTSFRHIVDAELADEKKAMLEASVWPISTVWGAMASNDAWLLVQHSDADRDFQRLMLRKLQSLKDMPPEERRHVAYLEDRLRVADGKPQVYGTQGRCEGSVWRMDPVQDPDNLDKRRHDIGLAPMQDYAKDAVEFCR